MRETRSAGIAAALAAVLMFAVVAASAKIRVAGGIDVGLERGVHRIAASTVALVVAALAWLCWRNARLRRMALAAFALMLALSVVGAIGGTAPPPGIAFFNQAGGLALTAMLAWLWARAQWPARDALRPVALAATAFAGAQCLYGAVLAAFAAHPGTLAMLVHAALGLAAAGALAGTRHPLGVLAALAAPAIGAWTMLPSAHGLAPVAHAVSAALVLAAAAALHGRAPKEENAHA